MSCAVMHLLPGRSSSGHLRCFHTLHEAIIQAIRIHSVSSPHPQLVLVSFFVALHLSNELLLVVLDKILLDLISDLNRGTPIDFQIQSGPCGNTMIPI